MTEITVVCDECGERVDGLIDTATMPDGEPIIMTAGFYIYDSGVSCDDCVAGTADIENTGSDRP